MDNYSSITFTTGTYNLNSYFGYNNIITFDDTTISLPTLPQEGYNLTINNIGTTNTVKILPQTGQTLNGVINQSYLFTGNNYLIPFAYNTSWIVVAGPIGATGVKGPTGSIGATGPTGRTGSAGSIGITGNVGANGATGSIGATGSTGRTGTLGGLFPAYIFGDGSDGGATFDGTNTYNTFSTLTGGIYFLNRDVYLTTATVGITTTLRPNGFRLFVNDTLTVTGTISAAGNSGNSAVGGAALPSGTLGGSSKGGDGGIDDKVGLPGDNLSPNACGGNGTQGGAGATNPIDRPGGIGGVCTPPIAKFGGIQVVNALPYNLMGNNKDSTTDSKLKGGAGSGGAGSVNNSIGGAAGSGGAVLLISARNLAGAGTITAQGGKGSNGTIGTGTGSGSGSGGGGGFIILIYNIKTFNGTTTVAGGLPGTPSGTGGSGSSGSPGLLKEFQIQ